jgi:hypothetical protein
MPLEKYQNKIVWSQLSKNPSIFEYDYFGMKNHFLSTYKKKLIEWQSKWKEWGIFIQAR